MSEVGFVKLHRRLLDWEWYEDNPTKILFLHILLKVNHCDKKWKGIDIKRGEFLTGRLELAKQTNLSEQQVKTALSKLQKTQEITIKATNRYSIIKLENYCLYQDKKVDSNQRSNQQITSEATNKQPTSNQQATTTKEYKELNNVKKLINTPTGKPSKLCDDFHFEMANSLGDFIETSKQINIKPTQRKTWANDIRLLMTRDISMREDVKGDVIKAIQAVIDHTGKQYFPIIQSGSAFREKFSKIEAAVERMKPKQKEETPQERAARRLREYEEEQRLMGEATV